MTIIVRINIKNSKTMIAPNNNKVLLIFFLFYYSAENTTRGFFKILSYILYSPWCPELIHFIASTIIQFVNIVGTETFLGPQGALKASFNFNKFSVNFSILNF